LHKIIIAIALVLLVASASAAPDVSGSWTLKMKGITGEDEEFEMVIQAKGEKLKVTVKESTDGTMSGSGKLKGDAIKFQLRSKGDMPVAFEFSGTVDGNKMSGTRTADYLDGMGGPPGGPDGPGGPGGFGGGPPPMFLNPQGSSQISQKWTAAKK
jgi:hypothetical protein